MLIKSIWTEGDKRRHSLTILTEVMVWALLLSGAVDNSASFKVTVHEPLI